MGIIKEFKQFALKGNMVDMAVGVIIGSAFGKIVSSLVNDVLMPPIGRLIGNVNFTELYFTLDGNTYETLAKAKAAGAPVLTYGYFLQSIIDFLIIAFAVFMLIKAMNHIRKKAEVDTTPEPTAQEKLLGEIRDILKKNEAAKK